MVRRMNIQDAQRLLKARRFIDGALLSLPPSPL
jgi:hypothetical protein